MIQVNSMIYRKGDTAIINNKVKYWIIYIVIISIFVLVLLQMNAIIALFLGNRVVTPMYDYNDICTYDSNTEVLFVVNEFNLIEGITERVTLSGWAVCQIDNSITSNRYIEIILISEDLCYRVPTEKIRSTAAVNKVSKKLDLQTELLGYTVEFTTLTMKSGEYEIYIYVREGNDQYGLVRTGCCLSLNKKGSLIRKQKRHFRTEDLTYSLDGNVRSTDEYQEGILYHNHAQQGPYMKIDAGDYRISIYGENLTQCEYWCSSELGTQLYETYEILFTNELIEYEIHLEETVRAIEFVLINRGEDISIVEYLDLEYLS